VKIPEVATQRLCLREPRIDDADQWAEFVTDPEFTRYVPTSRVKRTPRERAERQIAVYQSRWTQEPLATGWSVVRRSDGRFIGLGGVEPTPDGDGEIDYFLGRPYWGQGYATEIARAMIQYSFAHTPVRRIVAAVVPANIASVKVVERLGFTYEYDVNYLELAGNPDLILDPPIVAYYALKRDQL
jgi:ribosomal-protein-alanine N-acetyltransferase